MNRKDTEVDYAEITALLLVHEGLRGLSIEAKRRVLAVMLAICKTGYDEALDALDEALDALDELKEKR